MATKVLIAMDQMVKSKDALGPAAGALQAKEGRGKFITLEGGEGAGKSTQAEMLAQHLQSIGVGVLLTRGPDAILSRGTTLDMVLDRPLTFDSSEIDFSHSMSRTNAGDGPGPLPSKKDQSLPRRRFPI